MAFLTADIGGVERKFTVRPDEMRAYAGRLDFAEFLRSDRRSSIAVNPAFVAAVKQAGPDLTHVMFKHPAKWIAGVPGSAQDVMRHIANKSSMRPPGF